MKVVIVLVETVTGQADVVRVIASAERHADGAVFGQDHTLLVGRQLRELSAPPQGIPERPLPLGIQYGSVADDAGDVLKVWLVNRWA